MCECVGVGVGVGEESGQDGMTTQHATNMRSMACNMRSMACNMATIELVCTCVRALDRHNAHVHTVRQLPFAVAAATAVTGRPQRACAVSTATVAAWPQRDGGCIVGTKVVGVVL